MKTILVAVDGSRASIHAARKAVELGQGLGGEVTLVHVTAPTLMPAEMPIAVPGLREAELAEGAAVLTKITLELEQPRLKTLNLLGSPAEVIADTADAGSYDLVVVGNKGRGAVARVLVGSVADRLVHICKRPVMVVR